MNGVLKNTPAPSLRFPALTDADNSYHAAIEIARW
jgi:hypothetical protein